MAIVVAAALAGCAHPRARAVIQDLDGARRIGRFTPTHDLIVGAEGIPVSGVAADQPVSRWQIHPDARLGRLALFTSGFTGDERIELWTPRGIFIVGGPRYAARRAPSPGRRDVAYRVTGNAVARNGEAWATAGSPREAACRMLSDLARQPDLGCADLYFDFPPSATWADVESVLYVVLPRLDGLQGFWLGIEKAGTVTLHLRGARRRERRA